MRLKIASMKSKPEKRSSLANKRARPELSLRSVITINQSTIVSAIWEDVIVFLERALPGGATEAEISAGLTAPELLQALKVKQVTNNQFAQSSPSVTLVVGARR